MKHISRMDSHPCALVIGLCSHGLAVTRSLHAHGIEVHAFEANTQIPGFLTKSANVHKVASIKRTSLVNDLLSFRDETPSDREIVLFPTNDNNVKIVAENIEVLCDHFTISWADCAQKILDLLLKSNIERRCLETSMLYPKSVIASDSLLLRQSISELRDPLIVKPVNPQSGFKALKFQNADALVSGMQSYSKDFPVIVQEWISGTDEDLYFCALYLENGETVGSFVGRKLESYPRALGQTTVAVTHQDDELEKLTNGFFSGLNISGPVSLEFKKDGAGRYWVIEPTIGRTDFWLGLCITGGFDLPVIEYIYATKGEMKKAPKQRRNAIWFDSSRDPQAPVRHGEKWINFSAQRYSPIFSYLNHTDMKPFFRALSQTSLRVGKSIKKKIAPSGPIRAERLKNHSVASFDSFDALPEKFREIIKDYGSKYIFFDVDWFENFHRNVVSTNGDLIILCLSDQGGQALAVLPLWLHLETFHGIQLKKLSGLGNYYTPRFDIFFKKELCERTDAMQAFFSYIRHNNFSYDVFELYPMQLEIVEEIRRSSGISFPYYITENFTHKVEADYQTYISLRSSRHKNTIKRKTKKLEKLESFEFQINREGTQLSSAAKSYHDVYMHSWKKNEPYPEFIDGLIKLAAKRDWLRMGYLLIDKKVVASQIWLVANDTAHIYKLAYDGNFSNFSPGTLLTCAMLKHVIEIDNVRYLDFLHGADAFKKDWMDRSESLYGVQFPNPKKFRGVLLIIFNTISNFKKMLLRQGDWLKPKTIPH